jgi:hypothetical protein
VALLQDVLEIAHANFWSVLRPMLVAAPIVLPIAEDYLAAD